MVWMPLSDHPIGETASHWLEHLPLVLSGPILRRTESRAVTVWLALKQACRVTLHIYATQSQGHQLGSLLLTGTRTTIAIGQHLHMVAVTATLTTSPASVSASRAESQTPTEDSSQGEATPHGCLPDRLLPDRLLPGCLYAYDLHFEFDDGSACTLLQAIQSPLINDSLSYFQHQLPTFALPPDALNHLKIVHGSCRKPHGSGSDALPILDHLLEQTAEDANARPHQLFLTGDQIYGDDVADPWLWLLTEIGETLLGWKESLPLRDGTHVTACQLPPGQRSQIAETEAGFTAGLRNKPHYANSHLLSFGEYCTAYLLIWSPVLHPPNLPDEPPHSGIPTKRWQKEVKTLRSLVQGLWRVRRALANIPTYTIFDDHDISDDWYLNQAWCLRVLGKPLGRRAVQNGLQAYALFQGWGNTPEQFEPGRSGEMLLHAAARWSASQGTDQKADEAIARLLGLPPQNPHTGLPEFQTDGNALILNHSSDALDWHYTVRGDRHEVLVLDTRTWRGYPADQSPKAPPMLLSPTAFKRQLHQPLQPGDDLNRQESSIELTLVVAPTNLIHMRAIDWVQRWNLKQGKVYNNDVGDAWNIHKGAFAAFLAVVFQWRDRVVVLSGDIHYGYAVRLQYGSHSADCDPNPNQVLVQLTSSAFKNAEWKTQVVHTKMKAIAPEPRQYWLGWVASTTTPKPPSTPDAMQMARQASRQEPVVKQIHSVWRNPERVWMETIHQNRDRPDWYYSQEWIKRQPAQAVFKMANPSTQGKTRGWMNRLRQWVSLLWRNRWLQEGTEVVGHNNLGVVQFRWAESKAAIQDLYWLAPWKPGEVVKSRFDVPLDKRQ